MNSQQTCRWAIIPAAGSGNRFALESADSSDHAGDKAAPPKQYTHILGQSMLAHSLQALLDIDLELTVLVALAENDTHWANEPLASNARVETVTGGAQRSDSVLAGLMALQGRASEDELIMVHDAARPCVSSSDIESLLQAAADHSVGGLLASATVDTLKQVDDTMCVQATLDRDRIYRAQTPQVFRYGVLLQALQKAKSNGHMITDEASAVEKLGFAPLIVVGSPGNIKVTFASDLMQVEGHLRARGK